jgi:hypothetical protein
LSRCTLTDVIGYCRVRYATDDYAPIQAGRPHSICIGLRGARKNGVQVFVGVLGEDICCHQCQGSNSDFYKIEFHSSSPLPRRHAWRGQHHGPQDSAQWGEIARIRIGEREEAARDRARHPSNEQSPGRNAASLKLAVCWETRFGSCAIKEEQKSMT